MTLSRLLKFIGLPSVKYLLAGVCTGLAQFSVELVFAFGIQGFLVSIKILDQASSQIPNWWPAPSSGEFYFLLAGIVVSRGLIQFIHAYLVAAVFEIQRDHQRNNLLQWVYHAKKVNLAQAMTLFGDSTMQTSTLVNRVQNISILTISSLFTVMYLLKTSVITTILGIASLAVLALSLRQIDRTIANRANEVNMALEKVNLRLMGGVKNLLLIRIYGTQLQEMREAKAQLAIMKSNLLRYLKFMYFKGAIPQVCGFAIICFLSVLSVKNHWLESAQVITFFYLFLRLVQNLAETVKDLALFQFNLPVARRLYDWWIQTSNERDVDHKNEAKEVAKPFNALPSWKLENVTFSYSENDGPVLSNFNLNIPPGQVTVITGSSGAGKSTVISLLLGFFKTNSGHVNLILNGEEISLAAHQDQLIQSSGYVGPDSFLIEGSVRQNLVYGLQNTPTEQEIKLALGQAGCDFIFNFPDKIEHHITEQGQGLSAGQKQRISLARALLRRPKVLILDEATSNLDEATEKKLVETLGQLKGSMTMVIVTHRKELLKIADQVVEIQRPNRPE